MLLFITQLSVRGKNKKERLVSLFSNIRSSADDIVLNSTMKDVDEFFERERLFLNEYHSNIKDATSKADAMTRAHKSMITNYFNIA